MGHLKRLVGIAAVAAAPALASCATDVEQRHRTRIRKRAPADTDCPERKLEIETLKMDASAYRGLYRVKGCEGKFEYVCTPRKCVPKSGGASNSGTDESS